jgi:hypothetical protein
MNKMNKMNKVISGVSAAALLGLSSLAGIAPAAAAQGFQQRDHYISNYCGKHRDNQCNDWQTNHTRWSNNQYQNFYRYHRNDQDFGDSLAAGVFGFALGTMLGGALNEGGSAHVRACENAYRTYDVRTDSYMGFDGMRHRCLR